MNHLSYYLMRDLKFILPKCVKTSEPEDEQLCKLSAPYKEIKCIQNPRQLKK